MKTMQEEIAESINEGSAGEIKTLYSSIDGDNLENKLTILHARKHYLQGITSTETMEDKLLYKDVSLTDIERNDE